MYVPFATNLGTRLLDVWKLLAFPDAVAAGVGNGRRRFNDYGHWMFDVADVSI